MAEDVYQNTVARLEPEIAMIDPGAYYASAAISLKRIADMMAHLNPTHLVTAGVNLRAALDAQAQTNGANEVRPHGIRLVADRDAEIPPLPEFIHLGSGAPFDPCERAKLTGAQRLRMEGFMIALRRLMDAQGLRIMFEMDAWLVAQMVRMLFTENGFGRDLDELAYLKELDLK